MEIKRQIENAENYHIILSEIAKERAKESQFEKESENRTLNQKLQEQVKDLNLEFWTHILQKSKNLQPHDQQELENFKDKFPGLRVTDQGVWQPGPFQGSELYDIFVEHKIQQIHVRFLSDDEYGDTEKIFSFLIRRWGLVEPGMEKYKVIKLFFEQCTAHDRSKIFRSTKFGYSPAVSRSAVQLMFDPTLADTTIANDVYQLIIVLLQKDGTNYLKRLWTNIGYFCSTFAADMTTIEFHPVSKLTKEVAGIIIKGSHGHRKVLSKWTRLVSVDSQHIIKDELEKVINLCIKMHIYANVIRGISRMMQRFEDSFRGTGEFLPTPSDLTTIIENYKPRFRLR